MYICGKKSLPWPIQLVRCFSWSSWNFDHNDLQPISPLIKYYDTTWLSNHWHLFMKSLGASWWTLTVTSKGVEMSRTILYASHHRAISFIYVYGLNIYEFKGRLLVLFHRRALLSHLLVHSGLFIYFFLNFILPQTHKIKNTSLPNFNGFNMFNKFHYIKIESVWLSITTNNVTFLKVFETFGLSTSLDIIWEINVLNKYPFDIHDIKNFVINKMN